MIPLRNFLTGRAQVILADQTMDVALLEKGGWIISEVGHGGVSGLPDSIGPATFYEALAGKDQRTEVSAGPLDS